MLVKIEHKFGVTFLMVSAETPISVFVSTNGDVQLGDSVHNNGGYKEIKETSQSLCARLNEAGANMVFFAGLNSAYLYININRSIPISIGGLDANENRIIGSATHNNGGFKVTDKIDVIIQKVNAEI
jgi:hypothetical protein